MMKEKTTDNLLENMTNSNIDSYLSENEGLFLNQNITALLSELYQTKKITKAALARKSGTSEIYLHQVFAGKRRPSRDRLLCLCIGLGASLEETQRLLQQGVYAQLYVKLKRDAIISYGIVHHMELNEINDILYNNGEKTLI